MLTSDNSNDEITVDVNTRKPLLLAMKVFCFAVELWYYL